MRMATVAFMLVLDRILLKQCEGARSIIKANPTTQGRLLYLLILTRFCVDRRRHSRMIERGAGFAAIMLYPPSDMRASVGIQRGNIALC